MITATRTFAGNLALIEERMSPVLRAVTWVDDSTLRLEGSWSGLQQLPGELLLEYFGGGTGGTRLRRHLEVDQDRYAVEVDTAELVRTQRRAPIPFEGPNPPPWHLLLPFADHVTPQVCARSRQGSFAPSREVDGARVAVTVGRGDVLRLLIEG